MNLIFPNGVEVGNPVDTTLLLGANPTTGKCFKYSQGDLRRSMAKTIVEGNPDVDSNIHFYPDTTGNAKKATISTVRSKMFSTLGQKTAVKEDYFTLIEASNSEPFKNTIQVIANLILDIIFPDGVPQETPAESTQILGATGTKKIKFPVSILRQAVLNNPTIKVPTTGSYFPFQLGTSNYKSSLSDLIQVALAGLAVGECMLDDTMPFIHLNNSRRVSPRNLRDGVMFPIKEYFGPTSKDDYRVLPDGRAKEENIAEDSFCLSEDYTPVFGFNVWSGIRKYNSVQENFLVSRLNSATSVKLPLIKLVPYEMILAGTPYFGRTAIQAGLGDIVGWENSIIGTKNGSAYTVENKVIAPYKPLRSTYAQLMYLRFTPSAGDNFILGKENLVSYGGQSLQVAYLNRGAVNLEFGNDSYNFAFQGEIEIQVLLVGSMFYYSAVSGTNTYFRKFSTGNPDWFESLYLAGTCGAIKNLVYFDSAIAYVQGTVN